MLASIRFLWEQTYRNTEGWAARCWQSSGSECELDAFQLFLSFQDMALLRVVGLEREHPQLMQQEKVGRVNTTAGALGL